MRHILYLHGFRSSPESFKARRLREYFARHNQSARFLCPQLPASPAQAVQLARELVKDIPSSQLVFIGSSLGGYYATALAEDLGCPAVLLNPAVHPTRDLERHLGQQKAWHSDETFEFRAEYLQELAQLAVEKITHSERYFLLAATGDEILDWQEMATHYEGARQHIIQGSDHGLSDFDLYINEVIEFCDA